MKTADSIVLGALFFMLAVPSRSSDQNQESWRQDVDILSSLVARYHPRPLLPRERQE